MKNRFVFKWGFVLALMSIFLTPLSISAQQTAIERFFNQYMEDEKFTIVHITPKMFQMLAKIDVKDRDFQDVKDVLTDLKGLWVLTTEHNEKAPQLYKEALSKINTQEYELLMTVRDKDENVRIWTKEANGIISELFLLVGEKDEFTMLSFVGKIDLNKISKLAGKTKIDGLEYLKDIKEKKD
jgi:hypothetical protein